MGVVGLPVTHEDIIQLQAKVSMSCVPGELWLIHDETNPPCADEVVARPVGSACEGTRVRGFVVKNVVWYSKESDGEEYRRFKKHENKHM